MDDQPNTYKGGENKEGVFVFVFYSLFTFHSAPWVLSAAYGATIHDDFLVTANNGKRQKGLEREKKKSNNDDSRK